MRFDKVELTGEGDNVVEKPFFVPEKNSGKLYINKTQYFPNITQHVYDFYIGCYQVLDKYLKDRKGRRLLLDELNRVSDINFALTFTLAQMKKIDKQTASWI